MKPWQKAVKYCAIAFAVILIANIVGWLLSLGGLIFGVSSGVIAEESQSFEFSSDVYKLDIDISAAAFSFHAEECEKITVTTNLKNLTAKESGGKLTIKEKSRSVPVGEDGAFVEITYPIGAEFDIVDIDGGAGRLEIISMTVEILDLDLGAGEALLDSLTVEKKAEIDGGAGALTLKNSQIADLDLDMGVGKLILEAELNEKCGISLGIGETDITLLGGKDKYKLVLEKGIGEIKVDGEKVGNTNFGDGECKVDIEGGIGTINIKFG